LGSWPKRGAVRPTGAAAAAAAAAFAGGLQGKVLRASSSSRSRHLNVLWAGVSEAAPRVRAITPSSALTLIAAPIVRLVWVSECVTAFLAVSTSFRFPLVSFLHPQAQMLYACVSRAAAFLLSVLFFSFRVSFVATGCPRGTHSVFHSLFGPIIFFGKTSG
jgi:hypothetical protein